VIWNESGASLIENLVSLFLGSVIIIAVYGFYRSQLFQTLSQETKTATLEDARGALEIMVLDLKNAGAWVAGGPPAETGIGDDPDGDADAICNQIYLAAPDRVHIQMDLNGNGTCDDSEPRENVRYELTGPTSTCKGKWIIRRNGDCLVPNVAVSPGEPLFTYYDHTGVELGSAPVLRAIKRIRISFSVGAKNPDPQIRTGIMSEVASSVGLRN
jgi:type II secretory pathway component PulJ